MSFGSDFGFGCHLRIELKKDFRLGSGTFFSYNVSRHSEAEFACSQYTTCLPNKITAQNITIIIPPMQSSTSYLELPLTATANYLSK